MQLVYLMHARAYVLVKAIACYWPSSMGGQTLRHLLHARLHFNRLPALDVCLLWHATYNEQMPYCCVHLSPPSPT